MRDVRDRARDLLPSVLLTFLSIVQALALEFMWTSLRESPQLWSTGWVSLIGWIQMSAVALGILLVWLFYTSLVMRFSWVPSMRDSVLPFAIGLLEFTLIDLAGSDELAAWFYTLASVFAVSTWTSHIIFVRARRDPSNSEFFAHFEPARLPDFLGSIGVVAGLFVIGIVLQVTGSRGWLALCGLLAANAALVWQIAVARRFWHMSIGSDDDT
jgi:hypothetical protein